MRNPLLVILLVLLGLIPIAFWGLCVWGLILSYQNPSGAWTYAGRQFLTTLIVVAPAFIGGILAIAGAFRLRSKPRGARIAASIGLAAIVLTIPVALTYEKMNLATSDIIAAAFYGLVHVLLIAGLWRHWRPAAL